jgi:hypothetical protein
MLSIVVTTHGVNGHVVHLLGCEADGREAVPLSNFSRES